MNQDDGAFLLGLGDGVEVVLYAWCELMSGMDQVWGRRIGKDMEDLHQRRPLTTADCLLALGSFTVSLSTVFEAISIYTWERVCAVWLMFAVSSACRCICLFGPRQHFKSSLLSPSDAADHMVVSDVRAKKIGGSQTMLIMFTPFTHRVCWHLALPSQR